MRSMVGAVPRKGTLLALSLALAAAGGHAQDITWYGGVGLGEGRADARTAELTSRLFGRGFSTTSNNIDDSDSAWRLFGGYRLNERIAVEGSYQDLGDFSIARSLVGNQTFAGSSETSGWGLDLVGTFPLSEKFAFLAKAGINYTQIEDAIRPGPGSSFIPSDDYKSIGGTYGLGAEYNVTDRLGLRAEVSRLRLDDDSALIDDDLTLLTVSALYRFGAKHTPPPPAAEPAPAPPAPPPPAPEKITLSADALFDFDRAELKPEGRTKLDALVRDLQGVTYEIIIVTGHADRIGTESYNQALSERRAATVRNYLVAANVSAQTIRSEGRGESQPVTTPAQCQGRSGDALKACYQPDRRVEVEVSGERPAR